ncbi:hypothetical protein Tco_1300359, partial [Tanacetum coccineum]
GGKGLSKGLCLVCASRYGNNPNLNSLNDSQNISKNVSQSPPPITQNCCYKCEEPLDGFFCHQCTCKSCGKGAHYGYNYPPQVPIISNPEPCNNQTIDELPQTLPSVHPTCNSGDENSFTYDSKPNFVDDSPNVFNPPPQPSTYSYEFCGNDTYYGHDCSPHVPFTYNPEPFQPPQSPVIHQPPQETTVEMLQAREDLMESIETFLKKFNRISFRETPKVLMQAWDTFFEIKHACKEKQHQPEVIQELLNKLLNDVKIISEELAEFINSPSWNRPAIYYDDDEDYTIAITPDLATEEPVNSLSMGDEHLDTIPATESDEVIKSSVENLVPIPSESKGIPDKMCDVPFCNNPTTLKASKDHSKIVVDFNDDSTLSDDDSPTYAEIVSSEVVEIVIPKVGGIDTDILLTIKDDILREKLLNSSSTSPNFFLEETNIVDNSLPKTETFCFNLEEISSGSPTSHADFSLPDYEAFYLDDDHVEEKSSGSTTTHADFSQYDSFIFDLSIDSFPPADRSDFCHEEFAGELAHIISLLEYDCLYFKSEPDPGELTSIVDSGIRENVLSTTNVNLPFEDDQSPLLAYVVWIFLVFLTYTVTSPYLLSCGNEDTIFDPGISVYYSFMPGISHRSETFMKFNVYPNHLNESPMEILSSTCFPMDQ